MMATPSVTPRPERRSRIVRQSLGQVPPSEEEPAVASTRHSLHFGQQPAGRQEEEAVEEAIKQEGPPALYHQICVHQPANGLDSWARSSDGILPMDANHSGSTMPVGDEGKRIPLRYRTQLLHGLEVLCKRLLFHLVKASAAAPTLFLLLPFALLGLTLVLCSLGTSSWPLGHVRLLFPYDALQFGPDPNGGSCFLARLTRPNGGGKDQFPGENPAFDAPPLNLPSEMAVLLSTSDPMDSILSPTSARAFAELFHQIQDMTVQHKKHIYKWWDVCRQCRLDPVVGHLLLDNDAAPLDWHFPEAQLLRKEGISSNETEEENRTIGQKKQKLFLAGTIGDVELDPSDGSTLRRAHSLLMRLKLKSQLKPALFDAFERRLRRIVANFSQTYAQEEQQPLLATQFWSSQQLSDEMEKALRGIHGKLLLSWLFATALLALAQCRCNTYESRPLLGLQQAVAILLSSLCAYTVHLASGAHQANPMLFPLPYTLAALGVLIFSTVDCALGRYSGIAMHPTEKLAFLFIWDGPSVVLGLLWLALLCLISAFLVHSVHLLQLFLALSAGLLALLLFTLSFLLVCWLATSRRIASGLKWYQLCRSGDQAFNERQLFDYDAHTCARLHEKLADLRPCFSRRVGQLVCGPNFRMLAFALFCVCCIGAGLAGLANSRAQLDPTQFVSANSQSRAFLQRFRSAFPRYEDYLVLDFDGPIDYWERKEQIFSLLNWPVEAELASRSVSWLLEFDKFQKGIAYRVDEDSTLPLLTHVFLQSGTNSKFGADLRISQGQIHRSRMYLELTAKGRDQSDVLIRGLLERARRLGLPPFLEAPFSFSISHDIQVLPSVLSALLCMAALSALLTGFQPALALNLFLSNLFLAALVDASCYLLAVPLNVFTLGTLLAFGLPLNSACLLLFAHHFFNAGARQQSNQLRIQYAFQCALRPVLFACLIGPISFSAQFLLGQWPPIVLAIWKVICACSLLTLAQTVFFLPSLLPLFSDLFHDLFTLADQFCDENANAELTVDPMAENVYFVPSFHQQQTKTGCWTLGFGQQNVYPIGPYTTPLGVPSAYQPPPIELPHKSPALQAIQHSRQHSQQSNSPRLVSRSAAPIYSPPNRRREASKSDSGNNSFCESLESRAEMRVRLPPFHSKTAPRAQQPLPQHNTNFNCSSISEEVGRHGLTVKEQIYEEPDSPCMTRMKDPSETVTARRKKSVSPSHRRKYQV